MKSVLNYQIWQLINIGFAVAIIVLGWNSLRGRLRGLFYIFVGAAAILIIRYYLLWYKSGFDHYPGFDPYLF